MRDKGRTVIGSTGRTTDREYFVKHQGNMVAEPVCMRYERSDEAKACRKDYESHNITHGYREMSELHPRDDGKTNTLSTVLKDNPICEPVRIPPYGDDTKSRPVESSYPSHSGCGEGSLEQRMFSPNPCKQQVDLIAEPLNITDDGKSQTIKAQYQQTSPVNICCYKSTYGASGVAEPIQVGAMPRPSGELSTSQGFRVYSEDGKTVAIKGNAGGSGGKTGLYAITYELSEEYFKGGKDTSLVGMTTDGEGKYRNGNQPSQQYRIYSCDDKAQVLNTFANENYIVPSMDVKEATAKGYTEIDCGDCVDLQHINSKNRRGRNMKNKTNALQTSNEFYQYVGYVIEFADGKPIKAIGKDGKETTIYEVRDGKITIKGKQYPIKLVDGFYIIRKLTVTECMRLQTVPEWYEFPVSNSQAYKLLGNGWTCDVITHLILSALNGAEADTQTTLGV